MLREFDTRALDGRDEIDQWRAAVAENLVEVDCKLDRNQNFAGSFSVVAGGECGLATLRGSRHVATRDPARIRRTGGDFFMLFLQQIGRMGVEIDQREFTILPGDFFFYDATTPHRLIFLEPFEHIAIRVPRSLVSRNWRALQSRGCFQLTPGEPLSRIAAAALEASANSIPRMRQEDLAIAIDGVVDLFSAGASKASTGSIASDGRSATVSFARARAVVQARLRDSQLTPDHIASELQMSRRTLNKLFEAHGIGPMEYVIIERLEQAARDLSSPILRGTSITEIAFRWGFKNSTHFAKRFRQHFGKMPSEMRPPEISVPVKQRL